tara:strand:+ start:15461 stop:15742 length:282 start_codon:yes stop_codon:yes gene_type:complete
MRYTYKLFCQRKNFLIKEYFASFPDASYEDFFEFLVQRNVVPPPRELFNDEKSKLNKKVQPEQTNIEVKKEVKEEKKTRKRRRNVKKNSSDVP